MGVRKSRFHPEADVERRGKPSTWLPRQKLAEERTPDPKGVFFNTLELPDQCWLNFPNFQDFQDFQVSELRPGFRIQMN